MIRFVGSDDDVGEAWAAWQTTPWGRIRYRVMAETLGRALSVLGEPALRILDIGGADGADGLLS
jgi:S-adenosylmethionine-dependent methyltransferase